MSSRQPPIGPYPTPFEFPEALKSIAADVIFLTQTGSHAYGTALAQSDFDYRGIMIAPLDRYLSFRPIGEQVELKTPDLVIYDIKKFFHLASQANPNILELLYTETDNHLILTDAGQKLIAHRRFFLSKKVEHTYTGYAMAQLRRLQAHRQWLTQPPKEPPSPSSPDYRAAQERWDHYQYWRAHRNPQRAILEDRHGYDTKHAMHLVRLLRQCEEILTENTVKVRRDDASELVAIRHGAWDYEHLVEWAQRQTREIQELAKQSSLPDDCDIEFLDRLCKELILKASDT